jgi:hypothetical protein
MEDLKMTLEDILFERYAKLVAASVRAGLPYPTWQEYLKEWSTDND